jgi:hypothetical protein
MPHITIEYVIILPTLLLQIFLFPLTAHWLMNVWADSRRTLALQEAASHLGSSMQQLYYSLNQETTSVGTVTYWPGLPPFIEDYYYVGRAKLGTVLDPVLNSSKAFELTFTLENTGISVTTSVILGPNVLPPPSDKACFISNSPSAFVSAEKFLNGTICLYFGE